MSDFVESVLVILGFIVLMAILLFGGAWIALWLWNMIMVPVFAAPALTFWQMYGLMWLLRFLFPRNVKMSSEHKH